MLTSFIFRRLRVHSFRYLWLTCFCMIIVTFLFMLPTAWNAVRSDADSRAASVSQAMSHRIHAIRQMLEGISQWPALADMSVPVIDRAWSLRPLARHYGYWMIGVVDPDGSISSTLRYRATKLKRDYIPRIQRTKRGEISDPFSAGATGELNFSVFQPILRDGEVISIVFVSSLLTELNAIVQHSAGNADGYCLLLDSKKRIISHPKKDFLLKTISYLAQNEVFLFGMSYSLWMKNLTLRGTGEGYVSWFNKVLFYSAGLPLEGTDWMIIVRVRIFPTIAPLLTGFAVQSCIYLLLFATLHFLASRSLAKEFQPVDSILRQIGETDLFRYGSDSSCQATLDILALTRKGLRDELTGLPTRVMFRTMLTRKSRELPATSLSAFFYIDINGLKILNNTFGHAAGDTALKQFGRILEEERAHLRGLCTRYGSGEFVLFVPELTECNDADVIAQRLLAALQGTMERHGKIVAYGATIGISFYPLHTTSMIRAIQLADSALSRAKREGKGSYAVYNTAEDFSHTT